MAVRRANSFDAQVNPCQTSAMSRAFAVMTTIAPEMDAFAIHQVVQMFHVNAATKAKGKNHSRCWRVCCSTNSNGTLHTAGPGSHSWCTRTLCRQHNSGVKRHGSRRGWSALHYLTTRTCVPSETGTVRPCNGRAGERETFGDRTRRLMVSYATHVGNFSAERRAGKTDAQTYGNTTSKA